MGSADEGQNGCKGAMRLPGVSELGPHPHHSPEAITSQEQPEGPVPAPKLKTKVRLVPILFAKPERSGPREPCQAGQHCQLLPPAPTSTPAGTEVSHCSSCTWLLAGSTAMVISGGVPKRLCLENLAPKFMFLFLHCDRRRKGRKMWSCWSRSREDHKDAPRAGAALLRGQLG